MKHDYNDTIIPVRNLIYNEYSKSGITKLCKNNILLIFFYLWGLLQTFSSPLFTSGFIGPSSDK